MNNDLIKRSDAIKAIESVDWYHQNRNKDMVHGANSNDHQPWYKAQDIYEALKTVPSADRPQGKWLEHWYPHFDVAGIECSICSKDVPYWERNYDMPRYCPYCGAKMKGADDD